MITYETLKNAIGSGGWTTYTPVLSTFSGSFTTASASGKKMQIGKTMHFAAVVTITNNGNASGVLFSLPAAPKNDAFTLIGYGREDAVNGKMLQVKKYATTDGVIFDYTGANPNVNGYVLRVAGAYELP